MFGREKKSSAAEKKWEFFENDSDNQSDASSMDIPPPPPPSQEEQRQLQRQQVKLQRQQQEEEEFLQQQPATKLVHALPRAPTPVPFDQPDEEQPIGDVVCEEEEKKDDQSYSFAPVMSPRKLEDDTVEEGDEEMAEEYGATYVIDQDPKQIEAAQLSSKRYEYVVQERQKKRGWCIAAAVLIGLCLLAGLAIVLGQQNRDEKNSEVPSSNTGNDQPTGGEPIQEKPGDDCVTWIEPSLLCYDTNHTFIQISFEMCNALPEDYVGVYQYSDGLDPEDLGNPVMWLWSCGRNSLDDCTDGIAVYSISDLTLRGTLAEGRYQVHLSHRNPGGPYRSEGASRPFDVSTLC